MVCSYILIGEHKVIQLSIHSNKTVQVHDAIFYNNKDHVEQLKNLFVMHANLNVVIITTVV